jgi:hypothetical protein
MLTTAMPTELMDSQAGRFAAVAHTRLETLARQSIEQNCPYAFCFRFIRFGSRNGVLTIRGCLPSFYLKQVLIAHLQRVDGVQRVDDFVDVINSHGLSSTRP